MDAHEQALITVIIPAFNASDTIGNCLTAVSENYYPNLELIVVDDGSTDNTAEIAERQKNVRVIRQGNAGSAAAKNLGAKSATGRYLYFLDSDVIVKADTIDRLYRVALEYDAQLACGRYDLNPMNPTLITCYKALFDYIFYIPLSSRDTPIVNGQIGGGGDFISKAAFEEVGGFNEAIVGASVEREEFYVRFYSMGFKSVADPRISTRHYFPNAITLIKNYLDRIPASVSLMDRSSKKFTYVDKFRLTFLPIIIQFSLAILLFYPTLEVALGMMVCVALGIFAVYRDLLVVGMKTYGGAKGIVILAIHAMFSVYIFWLGVYGVLRVAFKRVFKEF